MTADYTDKVLEILNILCRHKKANPVKAEQIHELTGILPRETAEIAGRIGSHGFMVCSGAEGYYMAADRAEWDAHHAKEQGRAIAIFKRIKESKKRAVDQPTLFENAPIKAA